MARESNLGFSNRKFGPLINQGGVWQSQEKFFVFGKFKKEDVDGIQSAPVLTAVRVGGYEWRNATIARWGSGGTNATQLAIEATLVYTGKKGKGTVVTDPMLGDLSITIEWPADGSSNDPYQLLLVTNQLYPLP